MENFEKNRYDFAELIHQIEAMDVVEAVIVDDKNDIEIYGGNSVPKAILIGILQEFNYFDNLVQQECKSEYENSKLNINNFQFAPAWIKIAENKVVIEYWGIKVNSSFEKVFKKVDGIWREER